MDVVASIVDFLALSVQVRELRLLAMNVFVTGATGFVGSAIVRELLDAGHQVTGLARSDANAEALSRAGASVHRGALDDLDSLRAGARAADGVIHCAFPTNTFDFAASSAVDAKAIGALGEALVGTQRPLVVSSVLGFLAPGRLATEDTARPPNALPRVSEETALAFAPRGVRAMAVRLAPATHDTGVQGFVKALVRIAREHGAASYIGDGSNVWPAIHRRDAARLYRLALERGEAGRNYHATDEQGVPLRQLMQTIAHGLGVPATSLTPQAAAAYFGGLLPFAAMDCPASSTQTRAALDWEPQEIGLIEETTRATL